MKLAPKAMIVVLAMLAINTAMFFYQNPVFRIDQFEGHTAIIGRLDLPWGSLMMGFLLVGLAVYGMILNGSGAKPPPAKKKKDPAPPAEDDDE